MVSKTNLYGELERIDSEVQGIPETAECVDLVKIDADGHRAVILRVRLVE